MVSLLEKIRYLRNVNSSVNETKPNNPLIKKMPEELELESYERADYRDMIRAKVMQERKKRNMMKYYQSPFYKTPHIAFENQSGYDKGRWLNKDLPNLPDKEAAAIVYNDIPKSVEKLIRKQAAQIEKLKQPKAKKEPKPKKGFSPEDYRKKLMEKDIKKNIKEKFYRKEKNIKAIADFARRFTESKKRGASRLGKVLFEGKKKLDVKTINLVRRLAEERNRKRIEMGGSNSPFFSVSPNAPPAETPSVFFNFDTPNNTNVLGASPFFQSSPNQVKKRKKGQDNNLFWQGDIL